MEIVDSVDALPPTNSLPLGEEKALPLGDLIAAFIFSVATSTSRTIGIAVVLIPKLYAAIRSPIHLLRGGVRVLGHDGRIMKAPLKATR